MTATAGIDAAHDRATALVSTIGGLLMMIDAALHLTVDDTHTPQSLLGLPHEVWHLPGMAGILLALFGLIGIHARQHPATGRRGSIGFTLLIVGIVAGAAYSAVFHGVFLPAIDNLSPAAIQELTTSPTAAQIVRGIAIQALGLGLGAILYGVATVRADVLPPVGGWILISAAILAALNEVVPGAQLASRLLFGLAFVVLGRALAADTAPTPTVSPPGPAHRPAQQPRVE